jgi:hypothetical protein
MIPSTLTHDYGATPPDDEPEFECPGGCGEFFRDEAVVGAFDDPLCPKCRSLLVRNW